MSQEKNINITNKIIDLRIITQGVNKKFMCKEVGVPYQTFCNWLAGRHMPDNEAILDKIIYYIENSHDILRKRAQQNHRNDGEGENA